VGQALGLSVEHADVTAMLKQELSDQTGPDRGLDRREIIAQ
jgi:hypothetical protein